MIPATFVFVYLGIVLYIGIFAFRRSRGREEAEDYFLANRSLGQFVFLFSLFGTNMTAFAILGSSGHAFNNGIVTFGLMASSSALIIPLSLFLIGTRVWALGKRYGFITPVQMFRDRWECSHIGTVIFVVQAAFLVPYIIIGVMGGTPSPASELLPGSTRKLSETFVNEINGAIRQSGPGVRGNCFDREPKAVL